MIVAVEVSYINGRICLCFDQLDIVFSGVPREEQKKDTKNLVDTFKAFEEKYRKKLHLTE